jgi:hypothetical protein
MDWSNTPVAPDIAHPEPPLLFLRVSAASRASSVLYRSLHDRELPGAAGLELPLQFRR